MTRTETIGIREDAHSRPASPGAPGDPIPLFKVFMAASAAGACADTLNSGYIGQGPKVEAFEKSLKERFGTDFLLTTNSATSAEHLALHMLKRPSVNHSHTTRLSGGIEHWPGLEDGDEVLATPLTCTATSWPILANNLKIKWVDIDEETLNIDLVDLERKITPRTKIISFVHWGGYPVDLNRVSDICDRARAWLGFRPFVIEDCAHAFGSIYDGRPIGSHGNICTFSFQAIKHLTTGDGGMVTFPDGQMTSRGRLLRWYGIDRDSDRKDFRCEADVPEWGFKFHMNDIAATIGIENLVHMDDIVAKHQSNASFYDQHLRDVPGVTLLRRHDDRTSASWIYSILVERKTDFHRVMKERGVMASQVHERNDVHSCVAEFRRGLPTTDHVVPRLSAIPVGWWVTHDQRQHIVEAIRRGW